MKYIKLFEEFRPSDGVLPVKEITTDEFKSLLVENCSDFLTILKSLDYNINSDQLLFRKTNDIGDIVYSKPVSASHERLAPHSPVGNYHNLVLSNIDSWKEYPKRNKSICTSRLSRVKMSHGKVIYLVIPYNTTKIGVCSSMDMWYAFKRLTIFKVASGNPIFDYDSPGLLVNWFRGIIDVVEAKAGHKINDTKWEELKPYLDQKYNEFGNKKYTQKRVSIDGSEPKTIYFPDYDKNLTLLENLTRVLDPTLNDFSIKYLKDLPEIFSKKSNECWFEDDCLMIKHDLIKDKSKEELIELFG
jgi:hypothetical protein